MSNETDMDPEIKPTPLCCSTRLSLAIMGLLGFANMYGTRVILSFAMVCMINYRGLRLAEGNGTSEKPLQDDISGCLGNTIDENEDRDGEFIWSKEIQGLILSSFYWGYVLTQVPAACLAARFGWKIIFGGCIFVCSVLSLLTPVAARTNWICLIAVRITQGLMQGAVWPICHHMWGYWGPPMESSRLLAITASGSQIAIFIAFPVSSLLCEYGFDGGWPSIFYVFGIVGVLWSVLWMFMVTEKPSKHPRISPAERQYIEYSLYGRVHTGKRKAALDKPWRAIFTSLPVWAIFVTHWCSNWGWTTFLTELPTYMKEVLKFDIKKNGFLSAVPYVAFCIIQISAAHIADALRSRKILSTTVTRKLFNSVGQLIPAAFIVAAGFMNCNQASAAIVLLVLGVSFMGSQFGGGVYANPNDISPEYAGIVFGTSNTLACVPSILAPAVTSYMTRNQTQMEWKLVFVLTAAIYVLGAIFYLVFASGELQPWAQIPTKDLIVDNKKTDSAQTQENRCLVKLSDKAPLAQREEEIDVDSTV